MVASENWHSQSLAAVPFSILVVSSSNDAINGGIVSVEELADN